SFPFRARGTQVEVVSEAVPSEDGETLPISGAIVFHKAFSTTLEATLLTDQVGIPLTTRSDGFLRGQPSISNAGELIALWPVPEPSQIAEADREWVDLVNSERWINFTDKYTLFFTSGSISANSELNFQPIIINDENNIQTLEVTDDNKLLLFHLDVSLEWDARSDSLFLLELEEAFKEASAILYDITEGQVALGRINLFHDKAHWGISDVVIFADNSLRPSASIGGIVSNPKDEILRDESVFENAYGPGQVRMGTVWDTFGERTADLGEEWTRALAHELAHYLLFLPDNYIGFEDNILQPVNCPGSFMTNNSDPEYSEFLPDDQLWSTEACQRTLAEQTTGRSDWQTVSEFYDFMTGIPELDEDLIEGPGLLPLAVTYMVPWAYDETSRTLPARNYIVRDKLSSSDEILRLPNAQVYLIKTLSPDLAEDDRLIILGSPTGGGNRIRVRGTEAGDRICLIDSSDPSEPYQGCSEISSDDITIEVEKISNLWNPEITASSNNGREVKIIINQLLNCDSDRMMAQVYPLHYQSLPGFGAAPVVSWETQSINGAFTDSVDLPLPAFEIAIRVWVESDPDVPNDLCAESMAGFEAFSTIRLNPPSWNQDDIPTIISTTLANAGYMFNDPIYSPFLGPINTPTGGPINTPTGGPINTPTGGPLEVHFSGPINTPTGGPINTPTGGPINTPTGGPINTPTGGPLSNLSGGGRSAYAPILSADAQIIIYNTSGFFEDNGIDN
ncbi:MAG: PT domain-containing protein, partial [Chloroflexota bacterium]